MDAKALGIKGVAYKAQAPKGRRARAANLRPPQEGLLAKYVTGEENASKGSLKFEDKLF